MPRFSENEKKIIQQKLLAEGEKLFASFGLKKVTIDDLIREVGIAKATFYTFYQSKEYLYIDIVQSIQHKMFSAVEKLLDSNVSLSGKERVKQVFGIMYESMMRFPILTQIDSQTIQFLTRKVSKERMDNFLKSNLDAVQSLRSHGIQFTCDMSIASKIFLSLYLCWIHLHGENTDVQTAIMDILLGGVINRIVAD